MSFRADGVSGGQCRVCWDFIVKLYKIKANQSSIQHHNKHALTLKEPSFLDPSHSRGGGRIPPPLKILETDWRNIKCVVLVDSYDPPESIGTKKSTNIPCMASQWHHEWRHVKYTKITKNRQNHGFSLFFQAKVAFFGNDVCHSMLTHVLTPNKSNK